MMACTAHGCRKSTWFVGKLQVRRRARELAMSTLQKPNASLADMALSSEKYCLHLPPSRLRLEDDAPPAGNVSAPTTVRRRQYDCRPDSLKMRNTTQWPEETPNLYLR